MINFEKQFSNLLDYNPTTDSRLRTLRTQAFERFIKTGLPTKNGKNGSSLIFLF